MCQGDDQELQVMYFYFSCLRGNKSEMQIPAKILWNHGTDHQAHPGDFLQ